eukprot:COSAG02_NODE_2158_length_9635_cov_32.352139_2_plen_177_part_00
MFAQSICRYGAAAGGNDMDTCGPAGCECKDANSKCLGPIVTVGGAEHRISCCALCSNTPGCIQWAISSGAKANEPALCWLKSAKGSHAASPARVIGEVAAACVDPIARSLASLTPRCDQAYIKVAAVSTVRAGTSRPDALRATGEKLFCCCSAFLAAAMLLVGLHMARVLLAPVGH